LAIFIIVIVLLRKSTGFINKAFHDHEQNEEQQILGKYNAHKNGFQAVSFIKGVRLRLKSAAFAGKKGQTLGFLAARRPRFRCPPKSL
jgi:hypothetical protein